MTAISFLMFNQNLNKAVSINLNKNTHQRYYSSNCQTCYSS